MVDETHTNGNAALAYASEHGLAVFPCHWLREDGCCSCGKADCSSPGKHPLTAHGCKDATTDQDRIRQWWAINPQANVGMATGEASGVWVLDVEVDGLDDWASLIATEGEDTPYSPVSETGGGGKHLFFKLNGEAISNRTKLGGYRIDCRGVGGYVLLPPSTHASGSRYMWIRSLDDADPEDAPAWLVEFVTAGHSPASDNVFVCEPSGLDDAPGSPAGTRHNDLTQLVGREFARGGQPADVLRSALTWAATCDPPHDEADVHKVVEDISAREFSRLQASKSGQPVPSPTAEPFRLTFLSAEEFASTDFRMRFLIKQTLVAGQPCIIGGPKKSLKTSLLCDLAISLGNGLPFLETFEVPTTVTVGVLSGESGPFTIKETANRIALSKGVLLRNSQTHWCFDLPSLSRPDHLQALVDVIRERQFEVVIFDPAYLCLLDDGRAESAGNVFRMGAVLKQFAEVGRETGTTLALCHHSTKAAGRSNEPMDLEDLSQAGFAEFARQWMLLSRREPFEYGSGKHKLWLSVGGSAGHSGLYGMNADEGVLQDDFSGRKWEVDVVPAHKVIVDQADAAAERKRLEAESILRSRCEDIVKAMQHFPEGETKRGIRDMTTLNSANFAKAFETLITDGTVVSCELTKTNGQRYTAFRLSLGQPGHPTGTPAVPTPSTHSGTPLSIGEGVPPVCVSGPGPGQVETVPVPVARKDGWEF